MSLRFGNITGKLTQKWQRAASSTSSATQILSKNSRISQKGDLARYYEPAIQAIADAKGTIELNTAGWHKPCAEAYPSPQFLSLAASAGIGLVISSDAHAPTEIARDFPKATTLAQQAGFTETRLFSARQSIPSPL